MNLLMISASLNPGSNSRLPALEPQRVLAADGLAPGFLDLRELPFCDGDAAYGHPNVRRARAGRSRFWIASRS